MRSTLQSRIAGILILAAIVGATFVALLAQRTEENPPSKGWMTSAVAYAKARKAEAASHDALDKDAFDAAIKNTTQASVQKIAALNDFPWNRSTDEKKIKAMFFLVCAGAGFVRKDPIVERLGEYSTGLIGAGAWFSPTICGYGRHNPLAGQKAFADAINNITADKVGRVQRSCGKAESLLACDIMIRAAGVFVDSSGNFNAQGFNSALLNITKQRVASAARLLGSPDRTPEASLLLLHASSAYLTPNGKFDASRFNSRLEKISAATVDSLVQRVDGIEPTQALYALLVAQTQEAEPESGHVRK